MTKYRIVGKIKSSFFTTIPKGIVEELHIKQGDILSFHRDSNRIIVEKANV